MTHLVLIGLGTLVVVLTVVSALGLLPSLRIVPDNTHFDFTRFRRISFPISALLSIVAITLFFTHGLNFGIDFKGGTLMEVRAKSGTADVFDLKTYQLLARVETGPAVHIATDLKSGTYFVSASEEKKVVVVDGATFKVRATIPTNGELDAIVFLSP